MRRVLLVLVAALCSGVASAARDVTNEDLRSAILALAHITKESADKLVGHDRREQQVAEQLKRSLTGVDRRLNAVDQPLRTVDERLKKMELAIQAIDSRSAASAERENAAFADLLQELRMGMMAFQSGGPGASDVAVVPVGQALGQEILAAVGRVDQRLQLLHDEAASAATPKPVSNDYWGGSKDIQRELSDRRHNESLAGLGALSAAVTDATRMLAARLDANTADLKYVEQEAKEEVVAAIQDVSASTVELFTVVSKSYETLTKNIGGLAGVEKVLVQTGDNVLDAKRRVEYGVHQILLEVGGLVKQQSKDLNETLNTRFDQISSDILSHQTDNLGNLSSKIETEISQVWRQIGIMYEQLTASKSMLDRLQQQTEIYVNGSLQTMDGMEGKVGQITGRMSEVDDNLNFLLGRLSLVTQEFNQIKSGLASALDNIRKSFLELQGQVTDLGPGPNPIPDAPPTSAFMPSSP